MIKKLAVFGVPRSGTSWLSQIFNSHPKVACRFQPLFSFSHKGALNEYSTAHAIRKFYNDILNTQDDFVLMRSSFHKNYPVFDKSETVSHILFKETRYLNIIENMLNQCSDVKIFGIIRNPYSVLASWMSAPKEFNSKWKIEKEWRYAELKNNNQPEEFYGYEKWKHASACFLDLSVRFPQQFYLINYDDLKNNTLTNIKSMFDFCELDVHQQVINFIDVCSTVHHDDPYSVYRAKASTSDGKSVLPESIVLEIKKDLFNTPLQGYVS